MRRFARNGVSSKPAAIKIPSRDVRTCSSTHSFMSAELLRKFKTVPGVRTFITLSTIGRDQAVDSCVVQVWIESLDGDYSIQLPPLLVIDKIPVSCEDAPSENDVRRWPYLEDSGVILEDRARPRWVF